MESITIGRRRWFGLGPRRVTIEHTSDPTPPPGVRISQGRAMQECADRADIIDLKLTEAELNTIVLALKFGRIRYGMLLQLAEQRGGPVLSWEAIGDLKDLLEGSQLSHVG